MIAAVSGLWKRWGYECVIKCLPSRLSPWGAEQHLGCLRDDKVRRHRNICKVAKKFYNLAPNWHGNGVDWHCEALASRCYF